MESNRKALGRGLEQLFNDDLVDLNKFEEQIIQETPKNEIIEIDVEHLRSNPYQPRKHFDTEALNELAQSIKEHGIFQPIIVKPSIKGYEIIAGERRVKAARLAGLSTVPAIPRDFNDQEMMEIALLENLQRENLNAIEEAVAYKVLLEKMAITQEKLAEKLGKSRSHVTNLLGLLNLPSITQQLVIKGDITMGHARVLSKLDNKEKILLLAQRIINEGLSVRQLESIAQTENKKVTHKKPTNYDPELTQLETMICELLDTKVKINNNSINISYVNKKDLNRILEILNIKE